MNLFWLKQIPLKDWFEIAKSLANILAIIIGGFWAYRLFWMKRQRFPRLDIKYGFVHKSITREKILLNVTVAIFNRGEVLARLKNGEIWVQQVLPLPTNLGPKINEGLDPIKFLREFISHESREMWQTEIPWPVIARVQSEWTDWQKEIEPGNSLQLRYDFILDRNTQLVKIYTFYENVSKRYRATKWSRRRSRIAFWRKDRHPIGWESATFYDLGASG